MAWIKTLSPRDSKRDLRKALREIRSSFPPEYSIPVESASSTGESIIESHSLIPNAMFHSFMTLSSLLSKDLPLERRHHEMIATVVSNANNCHYWVESHAEFLRLVTLDDDLVERILENPRSAPVSASEKEMCDYVLQLTEDAVEISPDNHVRLRDAGFDDTAILQITLIAAWFNYINRVADALGVGRE